MLDNSQSGMPQKRARPAFPKRAVITGGMPYGNKDLHFGHIGGVFVQADVFARFLRDRIGEENVIFVSGTDCYGSPIFEDYRKQKAQGEFDGSLEQFVEFNYKRQKSTLESYEISTNLFAASGLGRAAEIHQEITDFFLQTLFLHKHLQKRTTPQFYDAKRQTFLNGRQVTGRCPVQGCKSEKAYADECSLGHQFEPRDLLLPCSVLTGDTPEMREVTNWYLDLPKFRNLLQKWISGIKESEAWRRFVISSVEENFVAPTIHVTKDQLDSYNEISSQLPKYTEQEGRSKSVQLVFASLSDLVLACEVLRQNNIRYRTGKTLVPFRLTGNLAWGITVPEIDGLKGLTCWVWPESLWAPISFTATYLEDKGSGKDEWRKWWCSKEAKVYQFIGEDNVFFYSLPQGAMFLGLQGEHPEAEPAQGQLQLTEVIANRHLLFLDKKASSSGKLKPPMARELLEYYTADQLRIHFFSLGLGLRSVSFRPKPLNPKAGAKEADPVLKEGNLLSNTFNRAARSCFYTVQKFFAGRIPFGEISPEVLACSEAVVLAFEQAVFKHEFHAAVEVLAKFIREINQRWSRCNPYHDDCEEDKRVPALIDAFHMLKTATVLMHPIAPEGTEMIREYLNLGKDFWLWEKIFAPIYGFMSDPKTHQLKVLELRVDFFPKHPSQLQDYAKQ